MQDVTWWPASSLVWGATGTCVRMRRDAMRSAYIYIYATTDRLDSDSNQHTYVHDSPPFHQTLHKRHKGTRNATTCQHATHRGHLPLLHLADAALGVQDEHLHVLLAPQPVDRRRPCETWEMGDGWCGWMVGGWVGMPVCQSTTSASRPPSCTSPSMHHMTHFSLPHSPHKSLPPALTK
jgi:hypothetical protein